MNEHDVLVAIQERLDKISDDFDDQLKHARIESNRKQAIIGDQARRLEESRDGLFRELQWPWVNALTRLIDKLDSYRGNDAELANSIRDELLELLLLHNIVPVDTDGVFDAKHHQVAATAEDQTEASGAVVAVWNRGYCRNGQVIRHAKVVVNNPSFSNEAVLDESFNSAEDY